MSDGGNPIDFNRAGKRPQFFADPSMDTTMTALLETMSENWALKERLYALEKALNEAGVLTPDAVGAVTWTEAEAAAHEAERQRLLQDAFRALTDRFQSRAAQQQEIDDPAHSGSAD